MEVRWDTHSRSTCSACACAYARGAWPVHGATMACINGVHAVHVHASVQHTRRACARCMRPAPRRTAQLLFGQPLLVLLVVELAQQPAVKRTSAVLGAPILVAARLALPTRRSHPRASWRTRTARRADRPCAARPSRRPACSHRRPGGGWHHAPVLLRLNELLLARVTAVAQRRWHHNSITSGAAVVTIL